MVDSTNDPPSAERNTAKFWKWVRALLRKLVNRKTILLALSILLSIDRVLRALKRLLGDF
ncbi:hypothetical protein HNQ36_004431 [Afipia massiliensis]|uniref:Uncharacterized protein n=1 Tax=Afipia massiliensis TaxID=211460 RepID=A0A840N1S0_9BRAD|nr:hypothetical protein [Afipia massiliensis]MBB5054429.1 hypothetical protein [Afipia massiliensis]